jgi:Na+-transporting NADH:ubiquinone oxidoreductase subunit B
MRALRAFLDRQAHHFEKGGKLERLYAVYEMVDTILYTPGEVTKGQVHVRDALDLKRMMITVVMALIPCNLFAMYNTGMQANKLIGAGHATPLNDWHADVFKALGFAFVNAPVENFVLGALYFLPVLLVTAAVGGTAELIFSVVRKHEINEGFLVTMSLFPLTMPPTIPLWQVGLGILFGVVIGKEVFGGTGMNILNPALTGRAFLFFAYPAQISGDTAWIAASLTDGSSGATLLSRAATGGQAALEGAATWWDAFIGTIPGSMGETSALCCLIGAAVLVATQIGSWRTMLGVILGTAGTALLLNAVGSDTNPMFSIPFYWHMVVGGWAFGMVFMATDPVSSAFTDKGRLLYGAGIGAMVVLVRVVNPAYPEGMMLAILFMNVFAPLIDHFVVQANIKRRQARYGAAL